MGCDHVISINLPQSFEIGSIEKRNHGQGERIDEPGENNLLPSPPRYKGNNMHWSPNASLR
jgi:hypothetical protein